MQKVILVFILVSMALAMPAAADQLGDREPREENETIDLMYWYRSTGMATPFWETSSFWGGVWRVVGGRGEWWR